MPTVPRTPTAPGSMDERLKVNRDRSPIDERALALLPIEEVEAMHARDVRERAARRRHYAHARAAIARIEAELDACSRRAAALDDYLARRRRREEPADA